MKRVLFAMLLVVSSLAVAPAPAAAAPSDCNDLTSYESTSEYRSCLVENTDAETIMTIVSRPPAESTQKEIDAVYAVSPRNDDAFGFSQAQKTQIREWMLWEKTGIRPSWYQNGAVQNVTAAASTTVSDALSTAGNTLPKDATRADIQRVRTALAAQSGNLSDASREQLRTWMQRAESSSTKTDGPSATAANIAVEQPSYRGPVETVRRNNQTVHIINGKTADIKPQNFDASNVIGFGVVGGTGQLTFDRRMGVFEYDTDGAIGSATLYWEVEEQIRVENGTQTVRTRYVATVRSDSNTTYQHVTQGELDAQEAAAANWSEWESTVYEIVGPDANVQQVTQVATNLINLRYNPGEALTGNFTGLLIALALSLSGWFILLIQTALHLATRYSDIKYINREESRKAEAHDLEEELERLDNEKRLRHLPNVDWNDHMGDSAARAFRSIGKTEFHGLKKLLEARRPRNLIAHRLQAMGHDGYVGVVDEDVAPDGGDGGSVTFSGARLERAGTVDSDANTVDLTNAGGEFEVFVDALDWSDSTLRNYDLTATDADPEDIHVEASAMEMEELIEALGADSSAFDSAKEWGEYLREMVEFVRNHEFTDDTGQPDDVQMILWEWMDTDDYLGDAFDIPYIKYESDALKYAVENSDPIAEADERVRKAQQGRDPDA